MSVRGFVPVWDSRACVPKGDVLDGSFRQAELALDLYAVANGTAKPPYDNAVSFFGATHMTASLRGLLEDVLGHLAGVKQVNPVLLFDVGFGGGKTHAMAALYYVVRNPEVEGLEGLPRPQGCRVVVLDGTGFGGKGMRRGDRWFKTLWADFLYQLGEEELAEEADVPGGLPDRETLRRLLGRQPTLILMDEIPRYMDLVKGQPDLLGKVKHFIHMLSIVVCEVDRCVLVVSVAGDAYADAADEVRRELREAMNILSRKMVVVEPVRREDVPHILRKRLFDSVNAQVAEQVAEAYMKLFKKIKAPEHYRRADYQRRIREAYPFHPDLIDVMYERLSTLSDFQRTRGALRLLAHVIFKVWKDKEEDALLLHPYHVDLSVREIVQELTTRLKEDRYANAVASDVYSWGGRKGKAQLKDEEYGSHFQAPLFRRACNTIYLYSLVGAREKAKGVDVDTLIAVLATPARAEHVKYYRDQVLPVIGDTFWYVDVVGNRFVFMREPNENRIIDQESQNIPTSRVKQIVERVLGSMFAEAGGRSRFFVEIFPDDPSGVADDTDLKLAILNPLLGHTIPSESNVPDRVAEFILNRDSRGNFRVFRNNIFLLVASSGAWQRIRDVAARLEVAKDLARNPEKYGILSDRRKRLQQKVAYYESAINDAVRASFIYLVYISRKGEVEARTVRSSGYGKAKSGQEVIWHILSEILGRVTDEALAPQYVKGKAWPAGTVETTTKKLYEELHRRAGVVLPANQSLFEETVRRGVEEGLWVLVQHGEVYAPERPPSKVVVSSDSVLLMPEEAGKRGLTDADGHLCPHCLEWPCQCEREAAETVETTSRPWAEDLQVEDFLPLPVREQIDDMDRWSRRRGISGLTEAEISVSGSTDAARPFRNLMRLIEAGRKVTIGVDVRVQTSQEGLALNVEFKAEGKGLKMAAKLLDVIPTLRLPDFEGTLIVKSDDKPLPVTELRDLIKNALGTDDPNVKLSLKLKPEKAG